MAASRGENLMKRGVAVRVLVFASALAFGLTEPCLSEDWALSDSQLEHLEAGGVIADGDMVPDRTAADIRAAIQVNATPEQVFLTLTDCAQALKFVPHLKRCAVLETADDGSWQNVEQQVDYGWLTPRANYVFHADYDRFDRIRFSNLRGDFHENRGIWEFRPVKDGAATLVTYEARVAPAFYVPRWMMRNMLRRDLPDLMKGLRARSEAARLPPATSAPSPPDP